MRTFPGWSLTFDEVPPTSSARLLARITGVDLKRVPPKSRPAAAARRFPRPGDGPQGLRRPRFSFFRFTCQTARDRVAPLSRTPGEVEVPCFRPKSDAGSAYRSAYR